MISTDQIERLLSGGTVVSKDGEKIGKVGQVFLDDRTGEPEWVTAKTGLFGTAESFVPLADADVAGDEIRVPFGKDEIKGAPRVDDAEGHLSREEEDELYRYYHRDTTGAGGPASDADRGDPSRTDERSTADRSGADRSGADRSGPDDPGDATRHDDRAGEGGVVGKHAAGPADDDATADAGGAGTVRLRRYVVTEYVTETVAADDAEPGTAGRATPGEEGRR